MFWDNVGNEFWIGLFFGSVVAVVVGWLRGLYRGWTNARDAYYQDVIFKHPTGVVPADVARRASRADTAVLLFRVGVAVAIWLTVEWYNPGITQNIIAGVQGFFEYLFG